MSFACCTTHVSQRARSTTHLVYTYICIYTCTYTCTICTADASTTRRYGGTGLGLAIVKVSGAVSISFRRMLTLAIVKVSGVDFNGTA